MIMFTANDQSAAKNEIINNIFLTGIISRVIGVVYANENTFKNALLPNGKK